MIYKNASLASVLALLTIPAPALPAEPVAQPIQQLLEIMAPHTIVILPDNPSEQETRSAEAIAQAVAGAQKQDGQDLSGILRPASGIAPDRHVTSSNKAVHFISVGKVDTMFLHTGLTFSFWSKANPAQKTLYVYGFGEIKGDVGYIESDRNPYPFTENETIKPYLNWIKISGLTDKGVKLAAGAFLHRGILNGVVTSGSRAPEGMLPDGHDFPGGRLRARDKPPALAPLQVGEARLVGWTQPNETQYLGLMELLDIPGHPERLMPKRMWRADYFLSGGPESVYDSLHRIGTERELLLAEFESADQASLALQRLRRVYASDGWRREGDAWISRRVSASVSGKWLVLAEPKLGPAALTMR